MPTVVTNTGGAVALPHSPYYIILHLENIRILKHAWEKVNNNSSPLCAIT